MRSAALVVAAALAGCSSAQRIGARSVVRSAASASSPNEAFGAQVRVTDGANRYHGEAIACDERRIYVRLNVADDEGEPYIAVDWRDVAEVDVALPGTGWAYGVWTALGTVSTISHGYFGAFTHGLWLSVGIPASVAGSNPSIAAADCRAIRPYLRFPQGLPETFRASHYARVAPPSGPQPPGDTPWSLPAAAPPEAPASAPAAPAPPAAPVPPAAPAPPDAGEPSPP